MRRASFTGRQSLLIAAVVLPLAVLAAVLLHEATRRATVTVEERLLSAGRQMSADIDREFDQAILRLEVLATRIKSPADLDWLRVVASGLLSKVGYDVVVHDSTGRQIFNSAAPARAPLPSSANPGLLKVTRESGAPTISDLVLGSVTRQPMISISSRLSPDEGDLATIALAIRVDRLAELLRQNGLDGSYRWALLDRRHVFVARSHDHEQMVGKELPAHLRDASPERSGVSIERSIEGLDILRAYHRSERTGFLTVVATPAAAIFAPVRELWIKLGLAVLLAVGAGLGVAVLVTRRLTAGVRDLVEAARALGARRPVAAASHEVADFDEVHSALHEAATRLEASESARQLLLRETRHRAANLLSVASAVANSTLSRAATLEEGREALARRLQALAMPHQLVADRQSEGAALREIIERTVEIYPREQFTADGPEVELGRDSAQRLSLLFHELCTNAAKYGALSRPTGHIDIAWKVSAPSGLIELEWRETGGPSVAGPARTGFGTSLIKASALSPTHPLELRYDPAGFSLQLTAPAECYRL